MAKVIVTEGHLEDIASAIRTKNGSTDTYRPGDMAAAIQALDTSGIHPTGTKQITENGTHDVTDYASANVQVPNTYDATDEGKVVSNGALVAQTSRTVTENGTYDTTENDEVVVNVSGGGGGSESANDVNFRDYDGTIVASYSASDFASLSAMPSNPSHTGLTAQGWNWTLADAKAYVAKYGRLEIGQMYITDDGKTRVYIHLEQGRTSPMLGVCPNGTVDVDWGDGTAHDTLTGTSVTTVKWTPNHAYAAPGDYVIKLTVTGKMGFIGNGTSIPYLLRYSQSTDTRNNTYINAIRKIEIGNGVDSIGTSAFYGFYALESITIPNSVTIFNSSIFVYCYSLLSVTIPNGVTGIGSSAFYGCYSLSSVSIPNSVTSFALNAFAYCYTLTGVTIPDSVTSIGQAAFMECYRLSSVIVPDSVTSIGKQAFLKCYGVAEYHFKKETPPTLVNTNAFSDIVADCIFYVPSGSLSDYQAATNWSTYASRMVEEAA